MNEETRPPALRPQMKEPEADAALRAVVEAESVRRKRVALERSERLAQNIRNSNEYSNKWVRHQDPEKPNIAVVVQTRRGGSVRLVTGRTIESMQQTLVTRTELRMLNGLSGRRVLQVVVGKIALLGKEK